METNLLKLFSITIVFVSFCNQFVVSEYVLNENKNNNTLSIHLVRQKTPREQLYNNAHKLKKYGYDMEWLYKKHHHKGNNRTNDSIAIYRYLDNEFYGQIVIGHPGQILNVAFDTAWTISWVLSSKCSPFTTPGCLFHRKYDHSKSSEWKKDNRPYIANEGSYNLTGFYSYDNISVAHVNVTAQSFVEMVKVPYSFFFNKADGIMGLGLQVDKYEPFFYKLHRQKKIKDPIFSIYLNRDRQSIHGGNIDLGFVNDKHIHKSVVDGKVVKDNITYLQVESGQFWKFQVDKIYVHKADNKEKDDITLCNNTCKAIIDTSANTIIGPDEDVDQIHNAIGAHEFYLGRYVVNCDTVNKLPKIDFVLGGKNFTLKGPEYTVKMSYHAITVCLSCFIKDNTPSAKGLWVFGGAFLAEYYSIYNIPDKLIGFVKAA